MSPPQHLQQSRQSFAELAASADATPPQEDDTVLVGGSVFGNVNSGRGVIGQAPIGRPLPLLLSSSAEPGRNRGETTASQARPRELFSAHNNDGRTQLTHAGKLVSSLEDVCG